MDGTEAGRGRDSGEDQQKESGSAGQESEDSADEAKEGDPAARSDRYSSTTVSREEWIRMLNQADPWDRRLKAQKEFEQADPPVRSVKAYRQGTHYYLLNRGETKIKRLRYRAQERDVNTRRAEQAQLYEIESFLPKSYVEVGRMDLEGRCRMAFRLVLAEWDGGEVYKAETREEERRLRVFDHSDRVPTLDALGLSAARSTPTIIDS